MHSAFDPASPQARAIANLWWWMFGVGALVWITVVVAMVLAIRTDRAADHRRMSKTVRGAVYTTVLILLGFLAYDFGVGRALAAHPQRALTIDVVGHQWWWEATYEDPSPSKRVVTANEIHVPVGETIQFKLRAADVIHSFWVPNLHGKRDLIPGYVSTHWFRADTAGIYRGQCAEFCGLQHAQMAIFIVAEPPVKFAAWLAAGSSTPEPPTDSTLLYGRSVFMSTGCALCHAIGGTEARGTIGPNLTHLKSRAAIAAGTLANTRANLTRWIRDPSAIKPGVRMPSVALSDTELSALVSYLETLK
jgi:cytochrome c oxidase subunit II